MVYQRVINSLTIQEVADIFLRVSKNPNASHRLQSEAKTYVALIRIADETQVISYDEAFEYFDEVSKDLRRSEKTRLQSLLYKLSMRFRGQVGETILTREAAIDLFKHLESRRQLLGSDLRRVDEVEKLRTFTIVEEIE